MDAVAPIAMGGLWVAAFAWQLQKRALVPINDPAARAGIGTGARALGLKFEFRL
jgi:hypothetical protein